MSREPSIRSLIGSSGLTVASLGDTRTANASPAQQRGKSAKMDLTAALEGATDKLVHGGFKQAARKATEGDETRARRRNPQCRTHTCEGFQDPRLVVRDSSKIEALLAQAARTPGRKMKVRGPEANA
ncbi:MAG: hypothetical protein WAO98_04415 [Alphaproteobacteria bacterium]